MQIDHACANGSCQCKVGESGSYCSEACRVQADNASDASRGCACTHRECAADGSDPDSSRLEHGIGG